MAAKVHSTMSLRSEIALRIHLKNHIGFVLVADTSERIVQLLRDCRARIAKDFHAVLPGADRVSW